MLWLINMGLVSLREENLDCCYKIERFCSSVMANKYGVSFTKGKKISIVVTK